MGVSLGGWGSLGLLVHQPLGFLCLGLDLTGGAGLAHGESFSPSRANLFPEMKLETYFSAVSHFAVLALTHLSKVLKGIDLLLVTSMVFKETLLVPLLSMVLKEALLVPFLPMVLKEVALLTLCSVSWKETFFLPALPMVLKEVPMTLFLIVSLTLLALSFFYDDSYAVYTNGLERSQFVSVLLSLVLCICGWGLERMNWMDGLERTWMQLSGSSVVFCHLFSGNDLERNLWSWCLSCFLWLKLTWKHFYIIHK